jgi:hypothetical protein
MHRHRAITLTIAMEIWLQANRRVLLWAMVPAAALAIVGGLLIARSSGLALQIIGGALAAMGVAMCLGLLNQLRQPRISYRNGEVLFKLRSGQPVAVPAKFVEAFFLGQGPANLPTVGGKPAETVNLVARISQKAPEWAKVEVKPALGNWCEGYVTIRGAWCEPLNGEVIRQLNRRLRELRDAEAAGGNSPAPAATENEP